jgi:two-component system KDP operon response regulator KdpE
MKILVVDDDAALLRALRRRLRALPGWEVTFAAGGAAALIAIDEIELDVVLTDLNMPAIDGARVIAAARQRSASTICVVMTSAVVNEDELGADAVFDKPADIGEMARWIDQAYAKTTSKEAKRP